MSSTVRRTLVTAGLAVAAAVGGLMAAVPAAAAAPANRACLGHDISTYARADSPHGRLVATLAHTYDGLGTLLQAHQAGLLPDAFVANSCND